MPGRFGLLSFRLFVALALLFSSSHAAPGLPGFKLKMSCLGHCTGSAETNVGAHVERPPATGGATRPLSEQQAQQARSPPEEAFSRAVVGHLSQGTKFSLGSWFKSSSSKKPNGVASSPSPIGPSFSRSTSLSSSSSARPSLSRSTSGREGRGDFAWVSNLRTEHVRSPEGSPPRSPVGAERHSAPDQQPRPSFAFNAERYRPPLDRISEATTPAMSSHSTPIGSPTRSKPAWADQRTATWPFGRWQEGKVVGDASPHASSSPGSHQLNVSPASSVGSPKRGQFWALLGRQSAKDLP